MKYPIGIQTFEDLIVKGFVYVDKTNFVYDLANNGKCYFLSRPRRFGKSLLISTFRAYFEGKRDLFKGLALEKLETEWIKYPVLALDLNTIERGRKDGLDVLLDEQLHYWETLYGVERIAQTLSARFVNVIRAAHETTKRQVAILIDEYDKPMLSSMENGEDYDAICSKLKGFYSVIKSEDEHIRFAMLTGVTRFVR